MFRNSKVSKSDTKTISVIRNVHNRLNFLHSFPVPLAVLLGTLLIIFLIFPYTATVQRFNLPKVGEVSKETIIAPFTFDITRSPDELERERKNAENQVLLVMQQNPDIRKDVRKKFIEIRELLNALPKKSNEDSLIHSLQLHLSKELSISTIKILVNKPYLIDDALYMAEELLDKGISSILLVPTTARLSELRTQYNTPFDKYQLYDHDFVSLQKGTTEMTLRVSDIPVKEVALEGIIKRTKSVRKYDDESLSSLYELLYAYVKPNVQIDNEITTVRKNAAVKEILEIEGKVIKDSEIVRKHQEITPEIVAKLRSLQIALDKNGGNQEKRKIFVANTGRVLLTVIPLLFVAFYIRKFEKDIMKGSRQIVALGVLVIIQVVVIRCGLLIVNRLFENSNEISSLMPEYLVPLATGSILTAILFNFRLSFILTLYTSIVFGVIMGFSHYLFLYSLVSGIASAYMVRNIRYRLHFFKVILPVLLVSAVFITFWHLTGYKFSFLSLLENYGFALISIIISVLLSMMFAPFFEKIFDITTDMTLVELSDMNHPILKRLSIEAAGTYNHSVLVGNLAESAAEKIGANALLSRVASYYHDIGKIEKADYFVENCLPVDRNRHSKLAPSMSALIICSHVKDGVELAEQYKLPGIIKDIIMQHHGTSTVSFFYEKALEQDPHKQVQEQDFRYSGPSPQTREAAIIMLADSVEAASRSLGTSSPKLLRELVKKIIRDKFLSSQLDQSDLTLKDLDLVIEGFMPVLQGIFHSRIEYPKGA